MPEYSGKQLVILEAAERLMANNGFDGTSVRDIAQEAGVNLAMISYYFGSKEKLLEAIIVHRISAGGLMMEILLQNKELTPIEKIGALIDSYVERMLLHPYYHKIIIREQIAGDSNPVNSLIIQVKLRNLEIVKKLVAEGIRKKEFNKSVDVPLMMTTIFGTFYQVLSNQTFYRQVWGMEELTEEAFQIQLRKKLKAHLKHILISALTYEV